MRTQSKVFLLAVMSMVLTGVQDTSPGRFAFMASGCFAAMGLLWVQRAQQGHVSRSMTGGAGTVLLERPLAEGREHVHPRKAEGRTLAPPRDTAPEQTFRQRTINLEQVQARLQQEFEHFQSEQTRRLAVEQCKALRQFSAGLGRELNDPVSALLGNLEHLQARLARGSTPELRQELMETLADARTAAGRIQALMTDLELLSTPADLERGPVDVVATLRCAVEAAGPALQGRTLLVQELSEVPLVSGDMGRLYEVFLRLLTHVALTAGSDPTGARAHHLRVRGEDASQVVVELEGPGCEFSAQGQAHAFLPFRAPGGTAKGTGLDLAVCHGLVTALGGTLSLEGQGGRAPTLRVCLPCHAAA